MHARAPQANQGGARPLADVSPLVLSPRGEAVTYPMPHVDTLRRVWEWCDYRPTPDLRRLAYHEAGHAVLFQWAGIPVDLATIDVTPMISKGGVYGDRRRLPASHRAAVVEDQTTALAASVFHAGMMAELLESGAPWRGPLYRPSSDHSQAELMLRMNFGCHSSGAHAFAQRVALHILAARWHEVAEIADTLMQRGEWRPR